MFGNLFGSPGPDVDARQWHPDFDHALSLFEAQDWAPLSRHIDKMSPNSAYRLITALGERSAIDSPFKDMPEGPILLTMKGGIVNEYAWRHRGWGDAHAVEDDHWSGYYARLNDSSNALNQALKAEPENGLALTFLIRVANCASDDVALQNATRKFFEIKEKPVQACGIILQSFGAKWGGSHEDMFAVTADLIEDKHMHPSRLASTARAHIEYWMYETYMKDDPEAEQKGLRYMSQPDVIEAICEANRLFQNLMANDLAAQQDLHALAFAHDNFGMALFLAGQYEEAARHVDALGHHPHKWPWVYSFGDPMKDQWSRLRKTLRLPRLRPE